MSLSLSASSLSWNRVLVTTRMCSSISRTQIYINTQGPKWFRWISYMRQYIFQLPYWLLEPKTTIQCTMYVVGSFFLDSAMTSTFWLNLFLCFIKEPSLVLLAVKVFPQFVKCKSCFSDSWRIQRNLSAKSMKDFHQNYVSKGMNLKHSEPKTQPYL